MSMYTNDPGTRPRARAPPSRRASSCRADVIARVIAERIAMGLSRRNRSTGPQGDTECGDAACPARGVAGVVQADDAPGSAVRIRPRLLQ